MNNWESEMLFCDKINGKRGKFSGFDKVKVEKLFDNINNRLDNESYTTISYTQLKIEKDNLGLDGNTNKKLRTGKIKIDRTVDFHGLTLREAFDLLVDSINYGYERGFRCILFITGKGDKMPNRDNNTIKKSIGGWLKTPEIVGKVIKSADAVRKDGGSGAIYVLLRRKKPD